MDGTFKSRPLLFNQLYVIHYQYQDHVLPGVFILMESKSERAYIDVFTTLQQNLPVGHRQGPEHFSVDFELASANAFKEVFTGTTEEFCFFHFAQSMWRKLQESGQSSEYMQAENEVLRMQFHSILSLCFVPPLDVPEVFRILEENCEDELDEVLNHLESYYVLGRRRGRGRRQPRYQMEK